MINLNDKRYLPDERITKESLLEAFSEHDIFRHYLGEFTLGEPMKSPIRPGDDIPSFNVFYSKRYNCLLFKDFAGKRGDCIRLVQELLALPTYQAAIDRIYEDMSFFHAVPKRELKESYKDSKSTYNINIVARGWEERDLSFWRKFGISLHALNLFNVLPISGYYHNMYYVETPDIAYAYLEYKDERLTFKIYRPTANKRNKWRNNNPFGVHQGYKQLPKTGKLLIITKSLKDVMSLYETMRLPSIGVQSETCFIKDTVIDEYRSRFDRVLTLFDNDRQGKDQATSYKKLYDIDPIFVPDKYGVKDYSDLVQTVGINNAPNIIKELL